MNGCANAGMTTMITPMRMAPMITMSSWWSVPNPTDSTTASMVDMNTMWWPVRKMYFSGVNRASSSITMKLSTMMYAEEAPYWLDACAVMTSLVGTTPCAPVDLSTRSPNGAKAEVTTVAPAPRIR